MPALAAERRLQVLDLPGAGASRQGDEAVGRAEVAIVFGNFVFQDQVITEGVPREIGNEAVVLVAIVTIVGEHEVGRATRLECFECLLDRSSLIREEAVAEPLHGDSAPPGEPKQAGAVLRFPRASGSLRRRPTRSR